LEHKKSGETRKSKAWGLVAPLKTKVVYS
jgi:hypothetical protein